MRDLTSASDSAGTTGSAFFSPTVVPNSAKSDAVVEVEPNPEELAGAANDENVAVAEL